MPACKISCGTNYDKLLKFLQPPADANDLNEVPTQPGFTDWEVIHTCYGKIETGAGREVWKARQSHPEVTAVAECGWFADLEAQVTPIHAVQVNNKVYHIIASHNVNEDNLTLQFWLRREQET